MKRYLDPKNDLVFKRIFGEHANILRAFLNAILPLPPGREIESLDYLPGEQVPEIPLLKHTLVDVRCRDRSGRQFIVEMQMQWTTAFMQRVLFNASKAYVRQLERGERFELLQPVIGLSLLDDVFDRESAEFFHHYAMVDVGQPARRIEGLGLVFVELPKFRPAGGNSARESWIRFLRETGRNEAAPQELANVGVELKEALGLAEMAAYSAEDLARYDRYWDAVSTEKTLLSGHFAEGKQEGLTEGKQLGLTEGKQLGLVEGERLGLEKALRKLMADGMNESQARQMIGL